MVYSDRTHKSATFTNGSKQSSIIHLLPNDLLLLLHRLPLGPDSGLLHVFFAQLPQCLLEHHLVALVLDVGLYLPLTPLQLLNDAVIAR